ncbi:MAG TPA: CHAT domain-containing protein, partial [Pyrinomonadaceae bacterium]|nr:CHAT domain-containing protein [Pyrinomonadaceae bacterium]
STSRWADEARQQLNSIEQNKTQSTLTNEDIFEKFKIAYQNQNSKEAWQMIKFSRSRRGIFIADRLIDNLLMYPTKDFAQDENLKMLKFAGDVAKQTVGDYFLFDLTQFYSRLKPSQIETAMKGRTQLKEGQQSYYKSEYGKAVDKFTEAQILFKSIGNSPENLFAENWSVLCKLFLPEKKQIQEIATFTKLTQTFGDKKYFSLQAQAIQGSVVAQLNNLELSKSFELMEKSRVIAEKNQDIETSLRYYQGVVNSNSKLGKNQDSLNKTFFVFDLIKDVPVKAEVIWTFYSISAETFFQLGLIDTAFAYQEKVIQMAEKTGIPLLKSRSFEQSALFNLLNNNLPQALTAAQTSLEYGEKVNDEKLKITTVADLSLMLGDIYRKAGEYQKAIEYYQRSQEIYEKIDYKTTFYKIFRGQALANIGLKNNELAQQQLNEAIDQYEGLRQKIYEESNRNSFFDTEQGIYDVAIDFACSQLNDEVQALSYAEINRARSLLDLLQTDKLSIDDKAVPEISLKSMNSPQEISKLQSQIPENSQILEYSVLDNKIISWVITKESIKSEKSEISADELHQKVKNYLDALNSNNVNLKNQAVELYQILIAPNEKYLDENKTLYIIPDKDLHFLPFNSLVDSNSDKYLIEKYTIGISPSLNVFVLNLAKSNERKIGTSEKILVVGNPLFDKAKHQDLDYLPNAITEATEVSKFYQNPKLLLNEQATKPNILKEINSSDVIHFALHAINDEKTPMLSGLILADNGTNDDGILKAFEIYRQNFSKTNLVVLSACQTGIDQTYRGEGAVSLARPFIALGVPTVVASLWKVESEPTGKLMIDFHRERKENKLSSLKALQQSQIKMIKSENPLDNQPKSWAGFVAIGN